MRAARYGLPLSLLMIDIDDFKRYNDQFGHRAGDAVLRDLAVLLKEQTRQQIDVVARYGGEEFAVILPSTGMQGAATVGERLRRSVADGVLEVDAGLHDGSGPGAVDAAGSGPARSMPPAPPPTAAPERPSAPPSAFAVRSPTRSSVPPFAGEDHGERRRGQLSAARHRRWTT